MSFGGNKDGRRGARWTGLALALGAVLAFWVWNRGGEVESVLEARSGRPLADVQSWHYQLTDLDLDTLAAVDADLIVTEHGGADDGTAWGARQVARLKARPDGRKRLVLAYFSVGEAEAYRFYWKPEWSDGDKPDWLGAENCAWPRNYMVRFWEPGWKSIVYGGRNSYLQRVIAAGFDGVYLDRVDIYTNFEKERPSAKDEMVQFVAGIAEAGRQAKPGFIVVAQNGEDLLGDESYRDVIDGLGKEDLLFGQKGTNTRNASRAIGDNLARIRLLQEDRKTILAVEYVTEPALIAESRAELLRLGFVPTNAHRTLDGRPPNEPRAESSFKYGTPEWIAERCKGKPHW